MEDGTATGHHAAPSQERETREPSWTDSPGLPAAVVALVAMAGVLSWWAIKKGAYSEEILLPSAVVLSIAAALVIAFAPWRIDLRNARPVALALWALVGLGLWSVLSATWSPTPEVAVGDGQRILVYAVLFGLGLGLCNLLGPRMHLAVVPVASAAAVACVATVAGLLGGEPRDLLEVDGTLEYPLLYRNANAAFFAIALFPTVALAAERRLHPIARVASLAIGTMCVGLFLLCQSRASVPALAIAVVVYALASPLRLRSLAWLALAALPALATIPAGQDLYSAVNDSGLAAAGEQLGNAGAAIVLSAVAACMLGAVAVIYEARLPGLGSTSDRSNRAVALGMAGVAAAGVLAFVVAVGNPVSWAGDRLDEFKVAGTPDLSDSSSRFTFNAGSSRYDLWRVALGDLGNDPLFGEGGGGFHASYLLDRDTPFMNAHDAHSIELEVASELGLPGIGLLLTALVATAIGIRRARRLGPAAASLGAVALASGSYWLVHSSLDWFWPYPAVTGPALLLLGAACAPAALGLGRGITNRGRGALIVALAVLALSAIPPWLSLRYVQQATEVWRTDLDRAYGDLERARDLNPLTDWPYLIEGQIAKDAGDREHAIEYFSTAIEKRPEQWAARYRLAELQAETKPLLARNQIRAALELNPLAPEIRRLAKDLGLDPVAETGVRP